MRVAAGLVALLVLAGCGSASTPTSATSGTDSTLGLLSASAVPGVPYSDSLLTVAVLTKDAALPDMASRLSSMGYLKGAERTFQGESRHLTFVVSRILDFATTAGAEAYLAYVHDNATAYFGVAVAQPLVAQGRQGWQFTPSACSCHMANPVVVGAVGSGPVVSWLEINGPDASPALLLSLLDPSNSAPAGS